MLHPIPWVVLFDDFRRLMIADALYKLTRKLLPIGIYQRISRSFFGREKGWKKFETYAGTFKFYTDRKIDFTGKRVLEVGCGDQFYTAFFFLAAGAKDVLLVEPHFEMETETGNKMVSGIPTVTAKEKMARALVEFNQKNGSLLKLSEAMERIHCFRDLSEIPQAYDGCVDAAFSYLVLEHFQELETFFFHTQRLLHVGCSSCNLVDLSDHTYHVFTKYPPLFAFARRHFLAHLRHSDRMFAFLNDSKCFMNRRLLPEYLELAEKNELVMSELSKDVDEKAVLHSDLIQKYSGANPLDLKVVNFYMQLEKKGP